MARAIQIPASALGLVSVAVMKGVGVLRSLLKKATAPTLAMLDRQFQACYCGVWQGREVKSGYLLVSLLPSALHFDQVRPQCAGSRFFTELKM